jgi:hypothetical protein
MQRHLTLAAAALLAVTAAARAQEFQPPGQRGGGATGGLRFDIIGFSTRGGGQVNKDEQVVLGSTVDIAELWSAQVRLRPSFEVGFGQRLTSIHAALEVIYRFQPDNAPAIPYVGAGVGYFDDSISHHTWPNLVMGFELPFRPSYNWLIEYHALDRLGRHRFLVGLATRSAGGG